jgi:uncharacterized protein YciW
MTIFQTTLLRQAGVAPDTDVAQVTMTRQNIVEMTQAAEDAVLRPKDCGPFEHDLRAALAARVAALAGDTALAADYLTGAGQYATLADPKEPARIFEQNPTLPVILAFVDKVANQTRAVSAGDITGLQSAGISDPDIVRLCELVAFLAYQIRVISGLRLMQGVQA